MKQCGFTEKRDIFLPTRGAWIQPTKYSGKPILEIPSSIQFPHQISHKPTDSYLFDTSKNIRACLSHHLETVQKYLQLLDRVVIPTDTGCNNLIIVILIQLHLLNHFTENRMRHQLALYFVKTVRLHILKDGVLLEV